MAKKQKSKSAHKSIFIRATDQREITLIEQLQKSTGCKAASQAFIRAGQGYIDGKKTIERLNSELVKVNNQLREANNLLVRLGNAHTLLGTYSKKFLTGKHIEQELF